MKSHGFIHLRLFRWQFLIRAATFLSLVFSLVPVSGIAGTLPTPYWSTDTRITTEDGYADLQWAVSGGQSIKFFRLTERFQGDSATHFVDHPTTRLYRFEPGRYEFWVQACTRDSSGYPSCGERSPQLNLIVAESVDDPPTGSGTGREPPAGQIRNPSGLTPGRWHNPDRQGHGWSFYWKSRLALPENHPLYGDAWDLIGLWYTYELRNDIYRPVYAHLTFSQLNDQQAHGTVWITRSGQVANVGSVTVIFYSESEATINWNANFLMQHLVGEDDIELLVAPDEDPVENNSHYSGLWDSPPGSSYFVSQGLGWTSESIEVVFEDEEGQPSWVMAEADDPVPGHTNLCFYFISEGIAPGTSGTIRFYENGCDSDIPASPDNRNGSRRFTGFEEEHFWVDFDLPGGSAPDEFVAGAASDPHVLAKAVSFHRVRYESPTGANCELDAQTPACSVSLTWFSDGNYSDASVFVHESISDIRELVGTAMVMEDYQWSVSEPGEYEFELRMGSNDASSLMGLSEVFTVNGNAPPGGANPETPPQPAAAPDMSPSAASSRTGATAGQFSVSPAGGASYRIPLLTAPGSGGMSPSVSLVYDSHAGNGPLGVGWSVEGFSVISRCAQTIEQDGVTHASRISFSSLDRFCLDGERLMVISGSYGADGAEYRKERDDYTRIISYGGGSQGPDHFKVWSRDGLLREFGHSENSRIETRTAGIEDVAFAWAQNRVEDTAGNYIEYQYSENADGPVDFVLDTIHYTGNDSAGTSPYAELRFEYQYGRSDSQTAYVAGVAVSQTRLLHRVDSLSRVDATSSIEPMRSYQLDYGFDGWGRAVLESLTECRDSSATICFEPTEFTWRKSEHEVSEFGPDASALFTADFRGLAVGDVNGDGRPDLLITEREGSDFEFFIATGNESGAFNPDSQRYGLPHGDDVAIPVALTVIDLNADGYQDVLFVRETGGQVRWHARLAGPNGMGNEFVVLGDCCDLLSPALLQVMDFNGDGLSDIMTHRPVRVFEEASEIVVLINDYQPGDAQPGFRPPLVIDVNYPDLFPVSTASGWELADEAPAFSFPANHFMPGRVDEFYGDGSVDILVRLSRLYRRCFGPCDPIRGGGEPPEPPVFLIGNGESSRSLPPVGDPTEEFGLVTFYLVFFADGSGAYSTYDILAKGAGDDCGVSDICSPHFALPEAKRTQATDINADGLADVVYLDGDFDWYYRLNTGAGFLDPSIIGRPPDDERSEKARFVDLSGDGFPEMIYPNVLGNDYARWMVQFNDLGHGFSGPVTSTMPVGNTVQGDNSGFLDFTADGILDQLFIDWRADGNGAQSGTTRLRRGKNIITGQTSDAVNVIAQVEDGFGARVEVTHSPLTDSGVYSRMNDSAAANWGRGSVIYDLVVPFYVVSSIENSAPTFANPNATSTLDYHYVGAKLQAGGRGLLGFAEVVEWNPRKQLRKHTRYRQDFPSSGLEADSSIFLSNNAHKFDIYTDISTNIPLSWPTVGPFTPAPDSEVHGIMISYSIREISFVETHSGFGTWAPRIPAELKRDYTLEGSFKGKTFTTREYDSYGNILTGEGRRYDSDSSSHWSSNTTINTWNNDTSRWRLGRLVSTQVNHWRSGTETAIVRSFSYGYDARTDLLIRETAEPGNPSHQVITQYTLDYFGNRTETTVSGIGMASRSNSANFDLLGRFVTETLNPYNQATYQLDQWDVFGNPLQSHNIDGVLTVAASDHMGRPFATYSETGSWSKVEFGPGGHSQCPGGTIYHKVTTGGGVATSVDCFDQLNRNVRKAFEGFLGSWIYTDSYFDLSGQLERISEPYFAGETRHWSLNQFDALGRVTRTTAANGLVQEVYYDDQASYCGQSGPNMTLTRTNLQVGFPQNRGERRNPAGETVQVLDENCGVVAFGYDAVGNLVQTVGIDGSAITIDYDDLGMQKVQMTDPDKGYWRYASNALGEITRQLDSKQQAIDYEYDNSGRVSHRRELSGVHYLDDDIYRTENHERTLWQNSTATGITGRGQVYTEEYLEGENGAVLHQRDYDFDQFGRIEQTIHHLEGATFSEHTTYDQFGRTFQSFDASGDSRGIRFHYNARGYLEKIQEAREGIEGVTYQEVHAMDPRGNLIAMTLGEKVELFAEHDPASGHVMTLEAYDADSEEMQYVEYQFDRLGNLLSRHDRSGSHDLLEEYAYDELNRLEQVLLTDPQNGFNQYITQSLNYDNSGNITYRSGVGSYSYGQGMAGPHAVTRAGSRTYDYDANGNQVSSSDGRSIFYSVFDLAQRIERGSEFTEFSYGLGNIRYKRVDDNAVDQLKTTITIGNVDHIQENSSNPYIKRYIGDFAIVDFYPTSEQSNAWYLTKDHLGSIHSISDADGQKVHENHFGPWGIRQDLDWQGSLTESGLQIANSFTSRGFTGHEHADGLGVIHMKGRIYDPRLGRFLQADPFVQAPKNGQSLNRYSYALNNPLSYTDPGGYFFKRLLRKWGRAIAGAVAAYFTWGASYGVFASSIAYGAAHSTAFAQFIHSVGWKVVAGIASGATSGFVAGAILTGSLRGAVKSSFAGAITGGLYRYFGHRYDFRRVTAETLAGGANARILGGKFSEGLRFALIVSGLNYANFRMRQIAGAVADKHPANTGKPSGGFYGDQTARAGALRTPNPNFPVTSRIPFMKCDSIAGACQGGDVINKLDVVQSRLGPIQYQPYGSLDYLTESFAGPHDWLRLKSGAYDPGTGLNIYREGISRVWDGVKNYTLVPVAAPFAVAGILTTSPNLYLVSQYHLYGN
jgi:RHS repeat-associated protein